MKNSASPMTAKRALALIGILAAIVLAGIVLFFVFGRAVEPILSAATAAPAIP